MCDSGQKKNVIYDNEIISHFMVEIMFSRLWGKKELFNSVRENTNWCSICLTMEIPQKPKNTNYM